MSLLSRLRQIDEKNKRIEEQTKKYTDEDIYQMLLADLYKQWITDPIASKYEEDSSHRTISGEVYFTGVPARIVLSSDECKFLNINSDIYGFNSDGYIVFNRFAEMEKGAFYRKRIYLTSLGKRVYDDLCKMAKADRVILSELKPVYGYDYHKLSGGKGTKYINVKLGEFFIGKEPNDNNKGWNHYGYSFYIKMNYTFQI